MYIITFVLKYEYLKFGISRDPIYNSFRCTLKQNGLFYNDDFVIPIFNITIHAFSIMYKDFIFIFLYLCACHNPRQSAHHNCQPCVSTCVFLRPIDNFMVIAWLIIQPSPINGSLILKSKTWNKCTRIRYLRTITLSLFKRCTLCVLIDRQTSQVWPPWIGSNMDLTCFKINAEFKWAPYFCLRIYDAPLLCMWNRVLHRSDAPNDDSIMSNQCKNHFSLCLSKILLRRSC